MPSPHADKPATALPLRGRVPIVVAVSGHRDPHPSDVSRLQQAIEATLSSLASAFPATPLVLLSPLAEGSDRIAAQSLLAVRDRRHATDRLFLAVPLPMSLPRYEPTFDAELAALTRPFRELLAAADLTYPVPRMEDPPGVDSEDAAYVHLAAYLARNAHVLLAVCEHPAPEAPQAPEQIDGGTATAMSFARFGPPERLDPGRSPLDQEPFLAIRWIPARRRGTETELSIPDWPLPRKARYVFEQFETFNSDVIATRALERTKSAVQFRGIRRDTGSEALMPFLDAFAVADWLSAESYAAGATRMAWTLSVGSMCAFTALETYLHFAEDARWQEAALAVYVALSAMLMLAWLRFRRRHVENRKLVSRSLAEALRTQIWWRWTGVPAVLGNYYGRHARSEIEWVREALRGLFPCTPPCPADTAEGTAQRIRTAQVEWVRQQASWYRGRITARLVPLRHWLHRLQTTALAAGSLGFLAVFADVLWLGLAGHGDEAVHTHHVMAGISLLLFAAGGILHATQRRIAGYSLQRRYDALASLMARADARLDELGSDAHGTPSDPARIEAAHRILRDLGVATLHENTSWLVMSRSSPLEIHLH